MVSGCIVETVVDDVEEVQDEDRVREEVGAAVRSLQGAGYRLVHSLAHAAEAVVE